MMKESEMNKARQITPEMTILEVIDRYRETETVFKKYDEQTGVCLCCQALFNTLAEMAEKYRLNLDRLLLDLEEVIPL